MKMLYKKRQLQTSLVQQHLCLCLKQNEVLAHSLSAYLTVILVILVYYVVLSLLPEHVTEW